MDNINIPERIAGLNWAAITENLNETGYAIAGNVLTDAACAELIRQYPDNELYRKMVVMERFQYGLGEYKYFNYPLPAVVQQLRASIYPNLAPIANNWMQALGIDKHFPGTLDELLAICHAQGQMRPTPLILKYEAGGYNALHQDLYGEIYFPMQAVLMLNEPGRDYSGGEFVLVEQRPRAQSKAVVLQPGRGDMLLFTTNFRPAKGSRGYHRLNMRHGVSEIRQGNRHSLGIIFHDAK